MHLLKIWLVPHETPDKKDDIVLFERTTNESDTIRVKYTPGDVKVTYNFTLNREGTEKYISNLLTALTNDIDPWHKIQIAPANGPSIMYHMSELREFTDIIMSTVDSLIYNTISQVDVPASN